MARKSLRGKGADIFLLESEEPNAPTRSDKRSMVTVYLPDELIHQLDQVYLKRRMQDRKAQKSHIVQEALERYFQTTPAKP
jgi:hypothetical protein